MANQLWGRIVNRFFGRFQHRLGIANTRRIAKRCNSYIYRDEIKWARDAYSTHYRELLLENDPDFRGEPKNVIEDGWAIDRSGKLPYLAEALAEVDRLIDMRAHRDLRGTALAQTEYLFHLNSVDEVGDFPGLLQFPTSSEVVATVAQYMGTMPVIALTLPKGIRVFQSTNRFSPGRAYNASQLYHRDIHDMPMVYAIVLARDATEETGPWCFLPASVSETASRALNYQAWRQPYRVTDERMHEVIDPAERIVFTGKRGDVLFIDSSRCFHFGSRDAREPGYRVMYAFTTRCRSDFQLMLHRQTFPSLPGDSRLRKMVLDVPGWQHDNAGLD